MISAPDKPMKSSSTMREAANRYRRQCGTVPFVRSFAVSDLDSLLLLNDVLDSDTSPDPDLNGTL